MSHTRGSPIFTQHLNHREQEKFDRIERDLARAFLSAGCLGVRTCEGQEDGKGRIIRFLQGIDGAVVAVVSSTDFIAGTAEELSVLIHRQVEYRTADGSHLQDVKSTR